MKRVRITPTKHRPRIARGIDLDSRAHLPLFKILYNARMLGKTNVVPHNSPSGRGYHIVCDEGFTIQEAAFLGDCNGRINYWKRQEYTFTFHNRHRKSGAITGREEPYNPLSEPFWRLPR